MDSLERVSFTNTSRDNTHRDNLLGRKMGRDRDSRVDNRSRAGKDMDRTRPLAIPLNV